MVDSLSGPGCPQNSSLIGFVGGADGLIHNHSVPITSTSLAAYRGNGGFELLARSIESLGEILRTLAWKLTAAYSNRSLNLSF